jgi:hypothetical protein
MKNEDLPRQARDKHIGKTQQRRPFSAGVDEGPLEDADDADDVRGTVTQLILDAAAAAKSSTANATALPEGNPPQRRQRGQDSAAAAAAATGASGADRTGASGTRQELEALSLMKLHKRAVDEGIAVMTTLRSAMESPDPKQTVIDLLLAHAQ